MSNSDIEELKEQGVISPDCEDERQAYEEATGGW